jgi:hypothetical protein
VLESPFSPLEKRSNWSRLLRIDPKSDSLIEPYRGPAPPFDIRETLKATVPRFASGFHPTPAPPTVACENGIKLADDEGRAELTEGKLNSFACIRNTINIWFEPKCPWTKGVILFYPPFEAKNLSLNPLQPSIYRSFIPEDTPDDLNRAEFDLRTSHMESFLYCLQLNEYYRRNPNDQNSRTIQLPFSPSFGFSLLEDLWRIIISEWLVFDTYAERSLNNIEKWFEMYGEDLPQYDLHRLSSQLMKIQRRITKYSGLVADQVESYPENSREQEDPYHISPKKDLERITSLFKQKQTRISHAINVAGSLMNTHQTKLAESRNAFLFVLTIVTSILLPFGTVAAIMAIPKDSGLAPSLPGFWKFWASSVPLLAALVVCYLVWRWFMKPFRTKVLRNKKLSNIKKHQWSLREEERGEKEV